MRVPRGFVPVGFGPIVQQDLHAFTDASLEAIGFVIYLRSVNGAGKVHVAFLLGNSKVAPRTASSVPRLELSAALEVSQAVQEIVGQLDRVPGEIYFYTDSQVVMGYLRNKERRLKRYAARRLALINAATKRCSWDYVSTNLNPADVATRPHCPTSLVKTDWVRGPEFLWAQPCLNPSAIEFHPMPFENLPDVEETIEPTVCLTVTCLPPSIWDELFK